MSKRNYTYRLNLLALEDKSGTKRAEELRVDFEKSRWYFIIPGKAHTDLYDKMDEIPFDKLEALFYG